MAWYKASKSLASPIMTNKSWLHFKVAAITKKQQLIGYSRHLNNQRNLTLTRKTKAKHRHSRIQVSLPILNLSLRIKQADRAKVIWYLKVNNSISNSNMLSNSRSSSEYSKCSIHSNNSSKFNNSSIGNRNTMWLSLNRVNNLGRNRQ